MAGDRDEVYAEKASFVENELSTMLRAATNGVVRGLSYERQGAEEFVVVDMCTRMFDVNVTADSLWAIAKDVMRSIAERY